MAPARNKLVFPTRTVNRSPTVVVGTVGFPEAVQLRLIDETGSPHIKLGTQKDGSGLLLGGHKGYLQLVSSRTKYVIKIVPQEGGKEQIVASADRTTSDSK